MKVLIWTGSIVGLSFFIVLLKYGGVTLGGIPTFILYAVTFWMAGKLCKMWDERNGANQDSDGQTDKSPEYSETENNTLGAKNTFACKNCKIQLTGWYKECPNCHAIDTIVKKELVPDSIEVHPLTLIEEERKSETGTSTSSRSLEINTKANDTATFCRKCGFKLVKGSNFCKKCGTPVIRLERSIADAALIPILSESSGNSNSVEEKAFCSPKEESNEHNSKPIAVPEIINLLDNDLPPKIKRAFLFIEDEEWEKADNYLEAVLDEDPTNAYAYIGKTMVTLKISQVSDLVRSTDAVKENKYYQKALRFAPEDLRSRLTLL